jgi:hypothetical protein
VRFALVVLADGQHGDELVPAVLAAILIGRHGFASVPAEPDPGRVASTDGHDLSAMVDALARLTGTALLGAAR